MFKSILSIICFLGISYAQIQHGGIPAFYDDRTSEFNFITIDKSQVIDRNFHPMVFLVVLCLSYNWPKKYLARNKQFT